jgi:hypothetical protein
VLKLRAGPVDFNFSRSGYKARVLGLGSYLRFGRLQLGGNTGGRESLYTFNR